MSIEAVGMEIDDNYLRLGGPVSDGWHFNRSHYEHHLYERGKIISTVTEEAVRATHRSPQHLYGVARGIVAP